MLAQACASYVPMPLFLLASDIGERLLSFDLASQSTCVNAEEYWKGSAGALTAAEPTMFSKRLTRSSRSFSICSILEVILYS